MYLLISVIILIVKDVAWKDIFQTSGKIVYDALESIQMTGEDLPSVNNLQGLPICQTAAKTNESG